ncbi:ABC-2 type transporter superfamily [Hyella patelloides LEGE 07179]|uniref:ABC-2 type transporter superfamily n=1 Tax=Hyella patelloides LEGE 07179 TaxID=945734 RepID=A0A563VZW2_9CYAN|nr:ABC transporter permease [Hyella patelloides]VEP16966.1 ABC-2 type transporter superfamily [Hyella patelloides LEGE 07179]
MNNQQLTKVVYTPESKIKRPLLLFRLMWRDLLASKELAWQLMIRDIKAQYRQSFLGVLWAFLPPIFMAVGFTLAGESNVISVGKTTIPYPAYVMFSTALWQTFIESLNGPIQAVVSAKPMLARVNFPREAIILSKLGEVGFNFCIKLILIFGLFIWFKVPVSWTIILAPVALIHLVVLGTFIGVLLAPLGVLYQDVSKGVNMLSTFWLFLTPVVYPIPTEGIFSILVKFNPVTPLLVTIRELATTGILTQVTGFWIVSAIAFLGLLITWIVFRLAMPYVIERISA